MKPFAYLRPASVTEAVRACAGHPGARFLGGGTNLVDLMKLGVETPDLLIDVGRLPLDRVTATSEGGLRIGATVRNSDLAAHPAVRTLRPALSQALLAGASGQVRNAATTGGNLLQRTRCPYFQDLSKPCNKRTPGEGCSARESTHRDLAVLGYSTQCVAVAPSDMAVALAALDATVHLHGPEGERIVPVTDFQRLPGENPDQDTVIRPGELITELVLPPVPDSTVSLYRKARDRASFAFALASVAAVLSVRDGRIGHATLAFGGLAHRAWRARAAEEVLRGAPATHDTFVRAVQAELDAARPLRGNAFKVDLARDLAVGVLAELTARAAAPGTPRT